MLSTSFPISGPQTRQNPATRLRLSLKDGSCNSRFRPVTVICASCILRKLRIGCINAQYMRKIFSQCGIYAQDCTSFPDAQYMHKIVVISPMRNICARFAQDCSYFSNVQYMCKICARLYVFPQCTIYAQDCTSFSNAQYMRKIVLLSPMRNICTRYAQDCSYF